MSSPLPPRPSHSRSLFAAIDALPKAELHLHMEGAIEPATVVALAALHGDSLAASTVGERYASRSFAEFLDAYKWVTSYLREPEDYALVARRLGEQLLAQRIVYAEVTLSVGVMLLRKQDVAANFRAIREATAPFTSRGLRLQWIFDAVRQFGPDAAHEVARRAAEFRGEGVVAFGLGGDEMSIPAAEFRAVYDFVAASGLRRLIHAGEIGGADSVRDAVELLGAERIGHGIATIADPQLVSVLAERAIPLEMCPTSNLRTGALARLAGVWEATLEQHPLPRLLRAGVPISISTDDPAMFETDLRGEYLTLPEMGLSDTEILALAEAAFHQAFLPPAEKAALVAGFRQQAAALGLL